MGRTGFGEWRCYCRHRLGIRSRAIRILLELRCSKNIFRNSQNVSDGNLLWHGNGVLGLAGAAIDPNGMAGIAFGSTLWAIQAGQWGHTRPVVDHLFWVAAIDFVRTTPARGRKVIILNFRQTDSAMQR